MQRHLKKKKKKKKKSEDKSDESDESYDESEDKGERFGSGIPAGFYYESPEHWRRWVNQRHDDEHYRPRVILHH